MNKLLLLIICCCFLHCPAFADNTDAPSDNTNWGINPTPQNNNNITPSEKAWDAEHDEIIDNRYGSVYSPAFLNRENINPNEADYGYGSSDGDD